MDASDQLIESIESIYQANNLDAIYEIVETCIGDFEQSCKKTAHNVHDDIDQLILYIANHLDEDLSIDMILEMHSILKRGTSDDDDPRYNVGGFKVVPNMIGVIETIDTVHPDNVRIELTELLNKYNSIKDITLEDIVDFHVRFEIIHPFADGNGRVGRIIMFKECLKHNIMPFIILDDDKAFYLRGLKQYDNDKMFLIDTIGHEQDVYEKVCDDLLDFIIIFKL